MVKAQIRIPKKLEPVFQGEARYRGAYGGRGSSKTRTFALMTAVWGYRWGMAGKSGQILAAREHLNSLADSSFEEIKTAIQSVDWLNAYYECGQNYIRSRDGRISYTFSGLRHNLDSIKSKARVILAWVDEAEAVSEEAWRKLMPTIREEDSECWITWNPETRGSDTDIRFRQKPPENAKIVEINWSDNPFFPKVLELERLNDKAQRPETYDHVWEGDYLEYREGAYFKDQLAKAMEEQRIKPLPVVESQPCYTFWDIGNSDGTAIWVVQRVGHEYRCIDFYESWGETYSHAIKWLKGLDFVWECMYLPHDATHVRQGQSTNKSPQQMLRELMPSVEWAIVPRIQELNWGIQQMRDMFPLIWIDEVKCASGLDHLRKYSRKWSTNEKRWLSLPDKSEGHSEAADALRQMAQAYHNGQLERQHKQRWEKPLRRNLAGIA